MGWLGGRFDVIKAGSYAVVVIGVTKGSPPNGTKVKIIDVFYDFFGNVDYLVEWDGKTLTMMDYELEEVEKCHKQT